MTKLNTVEKNRLNNEMDKSFQHRSRDSILIKCNFEYCQIQIMQKSNNNK